MLLLGSAATPAQENKEEPKPIPEPQVFVTNHQISNGGKIIRYKATASETYLTGKSDEPEATIWTVAYTQEGATDLSQAPGYFCF